MGCLVALPTISWLACPGLQIRTHRSGSRWRYGIRPDFGSHATCIDPLDLRVQALAGGIGDAVFEVVQQLWKFLFERLGTRLIGCRRQREAQLYQLLKSFSAQPAYRYSQKSLNVSFEKCPCFRGRSQVTLTQSSNAAHDSGECDSPNSSTSCNASVGQNTRPTQNARKNTAFQTPDYCISMT